MEIKVKKIFYALAACLSLTSAVHADEYQNNYCGEFLNCGEGCGKFAVGADWLYWETEQTGLNYGLDNTVINGNNFPAKVIKPSFEYDNGYRVYGDYTSACGLWNLGLSYTHVPTTAKNSYSSDNFLQFASLLPSNFPLFASTFGDSLNSLQSSWKNSLNYVDLDISRTFAVCNNFEIIPHIGFRVLWMKQRMRFQGAAFPEIGPSQGTFTSQLKSRFTGVGLEGGLKGAWQVCSGLSLVGHVGGSILYSHFRNSGYIFTGVDGSNDFEVSYKESNHRGVPTFDSFIGLMYVSDVCGYLADIHVGWEQHILFQTNDFNLDGNGSTTLQGLTLGGSVAF